MKRITICIDDTLVSKIRKKQAERLQRTQRSVSFSSVLCEAADYGIKKVIP